MRACWLWNVVFVSRPLTARKAPFANPKSQWLISCQAMLESGPENACFFASKEQVQFELCTFCWAETIEIGKSAQWQSPRGLPFGTKGGFAFSRNARSPPHPPRITNTEKPNASLLLFGLILEGCGGPRALRGNTEKSRIKTRYSGRKKVVSKHAILGDPQQLTRPVLSSHQNLAEVVANLGPENCHSGPQFFKAVAWNFFEIFAKKKYFFRKGVLKFQTRNHTFSPTPCVQVGMGEEIWIFLKKVCKRPFRKRYFWKKFLEKKF